jgi:glucose-1-phosphate thymidylyltransferase, short form
MKGIILAAGAGTRLFPASQPISKILLPVYDKPMIYYPLSTLMLAGIRDILVITSVDDLDNFKRTLGDGSQFGVRIQYDVQKVQRGIADAFIIAEDFIGNDKVCLILGDNLFYMDSLDKVLQTAVKDNDGATIFGYKVEDPWRFGVAGFDDKGNVTSLVEKPKKGTEESNYAVIGLYFYDNTVCDIAKELKPSKRGELEITDLNKVYLKRNKLKITLFNEDFLWIDAGTFDSLLDAGNTVRSKEEEVGSKIASPEETAYNLGYVTKDVVEKYLKRFKENEYFQIAKLNCGNIDLTDEPKNAKIMELWKEKNPGKVWKDPSK